AGQRRHWYLTVGAGSPVHTATPVSVAPTTASPWTAGGEVNAGGASAPSASVGHSSTAAAASETRNAGHDWRPIANLCKSSPLRLSARTVLRRVRSTRPRHWTFVWDARKHCANRRIGGPRLFEC